MKVSIFGMVGNFILCAGIFCAISAQTINIKGKVVGSSGPIEGAAVHLLKADKIEFTNASGEFNITDNSRPVSVNKSRNPFNRPVVFNRTESAIFIDKAYNLKGAFKAVIPTAIYNGKAVSGSENHLFGTSGIFITKTKYGDKTYYSKLSTVEEPMIRQNLPGAYSDQTTQVLQKKATVPDELVINALGKNQQKMEITDLGKDVGTITLTDNGKGKNGGYNMFKFKFEGLDAYIVVPDKPHPAKPWIWRSTFFIPDDDPMLDFLMMSKGYYRVHINQKSLMGNDKSIEISAKFHDLLVNYYRFWPKVVISGWSQAGFHIFRFAGKHPKKVSVVAADAATCNWRAWPKKPPWGMSKQEGEDFKENPSDSAIVGPMVKEGVAVIHEVRTGDRTVNPEWTYKMQELYEDMGGTYKVIKTEGKGHTDHFLKPELIEPFITEHNKLVPPIN